jgi:hypothetical protein
MEPYVYDGKYGSGRMAISQNSKEQKLAAVGVSGALPAYVAAEDLPEIAANLYEACGLPSPVILDPQQIPEDGSQVGYGDFRISRDDHGVAFELHGRATCMPPRAALVLAAYITAYAMQAEAEPDPEEVEELARALRLELFPDSVRAGLQPSGADRTAARAALRWMNARGKRDA